RSVICLTCPPTSETLLPYTTHFRSTQQGAADIRIQRIALGQRRGLGGQGGVVELGQQRVDRGGIGGVGGQGAGLRDQRVLRRARSEEQRLNSSHVKISYAVFCLKKK